MRDEDPDILGEVEGKPVNSFGNVLQASSWGWTRIELHRTRLVEHTKHIISETESQILLTELQGAAYAIRGNPVLLGLGIATLVFLVGIVFLVLYCFVMKKRFLIFHGGTFTQQLAIQGDPEPYLEFMEDVLARAEKLKKELKAASGTTAAASASPPSPNVSPSRSSGGTVVECPSCGTEVRLPAGSGGKKVRCSNCKTVMQAPPGV
jgi:LSD1 subclass zinc finger protein